MINVSIADPYKNSAPDGPSLRVQLSFDGIMLSADIVQTCNWFLEF